MAQGTTLLLVSHSPGDIVKHCDRAIFLKNGSIAMDGPSREVSNLYLDNLFGAPDPYHAIPSTLNELFEKNEDDSYHLRPGYIKDEHRWGNGGAKIIDYKIISNNEEFPQYIKSKAITDFYFKVSYQKNFDAIVPGFLIKTIEGIFLYGTNSLIAKNYRNYFSVHAGETAIYKFSIPVSLNEGHYLVYFGISSGDDLEHLIPLDRRYDSVLISVGSDTACLGILDFDATFECIGD